MSESDSVVLVAFGQIDGAAIDTRAAKLAGMEELPELEAIVTRIVVLRG